MRLKKSIFTKLMGSFILYVVILFFTFAVYLLLEAVLIGEGNPANLYPYQIIDENGNVAGIEILEKMGGWVEELEEGGREGMVSASGTDQGGSYHVIRIYGEKKNDSHIYSAQDLLELTAPYGETAYIGFFVQPENSLQKFLCFYDRAVMQVSATVNLNYVEDYGIPDIFILFFPSALLEILLISLYLKRKIKNPLDRIMAGMEDLKSGNTGARIDIKTEAEFEKIVDTFNLMAQQLEDEKAQKELLIRKKNQMLLELSHDIRTPLSMIMGYAGQLENSKNLSEMERKKAAVIVRQSSRMKDLINDLNLASKLEYDMQPLTIKQENAISIIRQVIVDFMNTNLDDKFPITWKTADTLSACYINADKDLLKRAIANLIQNSINHNENGCVIYVSVDDDNNTCKICIEDNGIGASDEQIDRLNNTPHYMICDTNTAEQRHGLGLLIVKQIIKGHQGEILIDHSEYGGFKVILIIPK